MKIAVFADIHGNLPAFEAALHDVKTQSPDLTVICGDIVNGSPDSRACWELAESLNCPILRGNHERYVVQYGQPGLPSEWYTERFAPVRWSAAQFSDSEKAKMAELPFVLRLPELADIVFCHASVRGDNDSIFLHTPEEALPLFFPDVSERFLVRGHQHTQTVRLWNEKTIVTAGSVGLPLDHHPSAQYLLLTRIGDRWQTTHRKVAYDLSLVKERYEASGYLKSVGPTARLFLREVLTGSFHWVPFLNVYTRWSPDNSLPLDVAISRFLNEESDLI